MVYSSREQYTFSAKKFIALRREGHFSLDNHLRDASLCPDS